MVDLTKDYLFKIRNNNDNETETSMSSKNVDLSKKNIENLTDDVFDQVEFKDIEKLKLSHNEISLISWGKFKGLENLLELHLNKNKLISLSNSPFRSLHQLHVLNLGENLIRKTSLNSFKDMKLLTKLNLTNNKLVQLNDSIFKDLENLKELSLNGNSLTSINGVLFSNLTSLLGLDLSNNQIDTIKETAFENLVNLKDLRLEKNKLSSLSEILFKHQTNLVNINLACNKIETVSEMALSSLTNLKYINLSNNKLVLVEKLFNNHKCLDRINLSNNSLNAITLKDFENVSNLTKLYLTNNKIECIEDKAFSYLENLIELHLDKNELTRLTNSLFDGLKNLQTLNLAENLIEIIEENSFLFIENLQDLYLSNNRLSQLPKELFKRQQNLESLDLRNNKLKEIHQECFLNLTLLTELVLSDNMLEVVQKNTFSSLEKLDVLYLDNNKISQLDEQAFNGLETLNTLFLNKNSLNSIRSSQFSRLVSLKYLYLNSNEIDFIDNDAFKHLPQLNHLYISNNKVSAINEHIFKGLTNLTHLQLESNKLNSIHIEAFKDLINLKQLDFYQNQIKTLNENTFSKLVNLEELNLSSNKIESFEKGLFENLTNVKDLQLDDNLLETMDVELFKNMKELEKIKLDYNKITHLRPFTFSSLKQLKHINLEENKIEIVDSKALWNLTSLKTLNLSNNNIKHLRSEPFGHFEEMNSLEEINLNGNDKIEFLDLRTLLKLVKLDKSNWEMYKKFKLKGIDFFPGGCLSKTTNEIVDDLIRFAYEANFSNLLAAGCLLKVAIYLDDTHRSDQNKKVLVDYFRTYVDRNKFEGFNQINGFKTELTIQFICSYLRESLVVDIFYETLMQSESQVFEVMREFALEFENDILINYLKKGELKKVEDLIKRFIVLSKEPVKSNAYYILLNCLFWTNDENETCFNYIIQNELNDLLDLFFNLNGVYLKKSKNEFLNMGKFSAIDIYKELLYLKNNSKCLIHPIARLNSNKTLSYLLNDKQQLQLLTESSMEKCIQEKIENISNNKLKQILDKYLSLCLETRFNFSLNVNSIQCLALRNDSDLFKKFFDQTRFIQLRNAANQVLKIAMENKNQRIAEIFLDKLIQLKINDYEKPLVTYDTLSNLFKMEWWREIEKLFDSFTLSPSLNRNDLDQDELVVVSQSLDSNLDVKSSNQNSYQSLPQMESLEMESEIGFNFLCLDCDTNESNDHILMIIAKSGQPKLIQHQVILRLVSLKWRFIPRFVYHTQTLMHLAFLGLFLIYVLNEFQIISQELNIDNSTNSTILLSEDRVVDSNYFALVITSLLVVYFLIYELSEALTEKFAYFLSLKNWLEFLTYMFALFVLITIKFEYFFQMTSMLASLAVLFGFIVLMLRLEKNSSFGSYVVAFRRSFAKTIKTLPFIILLFFGFIYSFLLRTNTGVKFISSSSKHVNNFDYLSVAKMTNMIIGSYELDLLGLNSTSFFNEIVNFFIYFIFLIMMTIISVNLLTGIAIGELESVLKEAKIFNIQQRIAYILRIQKIVLFLEKHTRIKFKITFKRDAILKRNILRKVIEWFKRHSHADIELIESKEKETNQYLIESEYNTRVNQDFMTNKMNENDFRLACIAENIQALRQEQMKRVDEIDLNVAKLEENCIGLNEIQMKKISMIDAKLELVNKQIVDVLNILTQLTKNK